MGSTNMFCWFLADVVCSMPGLLKIYVIKISNQMLRLKLLLLIVIQE